VGRELSQSLGEHLGILFRVRDRDPLDFASHRLVVATMEGERRKDGTRGFTPIIRIRTSVSSVLSSRSCASG
jgi:hypothetical protein